MRFPWARRASRTRTGSSCSREEVSTLYRVRTYGVETVVAARKSQINATMLPLAQIEMTKWSTSCAGFYDAQSVLGALFGAG